MKICYLCPDRGITLEKYNGSASHVRGLVRSFVKLGHQVSLVLSNPEGAGELGVPVRGIQHSHAATAVLELSIEETDSEARRHNRAIARALRHVWNNTAGEEALSGVLADGPVDLVYERYSPFSASGALLCQRQNVPHVLEVNAPLAWEGARHRGQALNEAAEFLELLAFQTTSRIIAVSEELREHLIGHGVDKAKIRAVPNGVDCEMFTPEGEAYRGGMPDKVVVGFVGSLKPWHGVEELVQAFRLVAEDPRFHLLVLGDGPMAGKVRDLQELLPDQVTLAGAVHPRTVPSVLRRGAVPRAGALLLLPPQGTGVHGHGEGGGVLARRPDHEPDS
jgi:glycosyltransferase involved in cell wall biosynthesis